MNLVGFTAQGQDPDEFGIRLDDPVFGNAGRGILAGFDDQITLAILGVSANHFHDKVCPNPVLLQTSGLVFFPRVHDIRFAKFRIFW